MNYGLDIKDEELHIQGIYGTYIAQDNNNSGFLVSVDFDTYVNEVDSDGEEYLVETGQEWFVPVSSLAELNSFIQHCENERLWNYMKGPIFRMKPDADAGVLYIKGLQKNFALGADEKGIYLDELPATKAHAYVDSIFNAMQMLTRTDKWWMRPSADSLDMLNNFKCLAVVTSGGNLQLSYKTKKITIGQKDDNTYWVHVSEGENKDIYYKDTWKEILALIN